MVAGLSVNAGYEKGSTIALIFGVVLVLFARQAIAEADSLRGKVIAAQWCQYCHQIGPDYSPHGPGPAFAVIANDSKFTADYIKDWIRFPHALMPNFDLPPKDLDDIVAYIHSLRSTETGQCESCAVVPRRDRASAGSGFFFGSDGHVLTVHHIVKDCRRITVNLPGGVLKEAKLQTAYEPFDLATLSTGHAPKAFARLREHSPLRLGERVVTYSYPPTETRMPVGSISEGFVSALTGTDDDAAEFQISGNLQPGSSGGPALDQWATVVGIAKPQEVSTARDSVQSSGINFAIGVDRVKQFLAATSHFHLSGEEPGLALQLTEIVAKAREFTVGVACQR